MNCYPSWTSLALICYVPQVIIVIDVHEESSNSQVVVL